MDKCKDAVAFSNVITGYDTGDGKVCNGNIYDKQIASSEEIYVEETDALSKPRNSTVRSTVPKDPISYNLAYPQKESKNDYSEYNCILVVILTRGEADIDQRLWSTFTADKCPTLAGKPKMFFFQAYQDDNRPQTDGGDQNTPDRIPTHADFLIVYSTANGCYSERNTTKGSWFIQALCEELSENAYTLDLMTILTFVSRTVAEKYESNGQRKKQIPCVISQLTKLIKFQKSDI
ncbi:caspase-1-like isoform X2 [Rhynchophorus ferrugineus]|uniref:caspase-1-like isoform X2 n=1 Tax=Rhynchophorus ferrugineus TaxID=354439 RepID=UPI003FCE082D